MVIDDELMRQIRQRALDQGISQRELIERALRDALATRGGGGAPVPFRMVTFGRGEAQARHTPQDFHRDGEEDDLHSLGRS